VSVDRKYGVSLEDGYATSPVVLRGSVMHGRCALVHRVAPSRLPVRMLRIARATIAVAAIALVFETSSPSAAATTLAFASAAQHADARSAIPELRVGIRDTGEAQPGTARVDRYISYDSSAKSVAIVLVAAANSAQGGFNFNGGSVGNQTITVPLGWSIDIDFQNHDVVPHSAVVIAAQTPLPPVPEKPAFARAYTSQLIDGLPAQTGHDTMRFTADKAGDYLIACGVPGHALSGMFIRFVVSANATAPSDSGTVASP
jgi:Sulfocyanin (SoxE).